MAQREDRPLKGIWLELQTIAVRGREVWRLVSGRHRWALAGAVLVMGLGSAAGTAIPLLLGTVVNAVNRQMQQHVDKAAVTRVALFYLGLIGGFYLMRGGPERAPPVPGGECLHPHRSRYVCPPGGAPDEGGPLGPIARTSRRLHGRITRSVDGFVRFLRISFLDFIPAILTGCFAIAATLAKQPAIALAMAGVVPISIALTTWQLATQKGVRLDLLRTR